MDFVALATQVGAPFAVAVIALVMLRDEGRRNAEALRTILQEQIGVMRQNAQALSTLAELIRQDHSKEK